MSAQRAILPANGAANGNDAAARRPMILFLGREWVETRQAPAIPATAQVRGIARIFAACAGVVVRVANCLVVWHMRARGRRALATLDARLRRDIGITELEVWREVNKPFWHG